MSEEREYHRVNGRVGELMDYTERNRGVYVLPEVTRLEIIGTGGGSLHAVTLEPGATLHLQDDGRTLKIFTNEHVKTQDWFREKHDWGKFSDSKADNDESKDEGVSPE